MIRFAGSPFDMGDDALVHEDDGAVAIDGGLIVAAGPAGDVLAAYREAEVTRTDGLIAPGFVDAHVHYPQIGVIASWGADLIDWLNRFTFPEEMRFGDPGYAARAASASLPRPTSAGVPPGSCR